MGLLRTVSRNDASPSVAAGKPGEALVVAILASHNRREVTVRCLASLFAQGNSIRLFAVLVDDGSADGTPAAVRNRFPGCKVVDGGGSLYWSAAMALAERTAFEEFPELTHLLWLNDDVWLAPEALPRLLNASAAFDDNVIVSGLVADEASHRPVYGAKRRTGWHPQRFTQLPAGSEVQHADVAHGNVLLVPRNVTRRLGPIDGGFAHAFADFDYTGRARQQGIPVVQGAGVSAYGSPNPAINAWLHVGLSLRERLALIRSRKGLPLRSHVRYLRRHGGRCWPVFVLSPYGRLVFNHVRQRIGR